MKLLFIIFLDSTKRKIVWIKEKCIKEKIKNKRRKKEARGTEAIGKGWELNDFVVHLS